jgi:hypothetical protein
MDELRQTVASAPDETAVVEWLATRVDAASAPEHNAKLETIVVERMKPEDQALVRQRHPVMESQPGLSKILDILDAEDEFSFGVK